ncbi:lipid A deacylase LpxR family protein [Mucilaginibacter jinjuensis]|uniref:Lipid A deacylase LpxR family protein n=1 Tax=Mucilaginibacter jinjuensis TaxID=1176721 RepID=A0ABY7TCB5_9SPHI|nr:lipid A deacylase LpxR family protein [Mucilaginibacter jinjuensis]WCT13968.1 lipid A deacylase LpxR family protein [Mucilaginibacter jinjuensis]
MRKLLPIAIILILCSLYTKAQYRTQEAGFQTDNDGYLGQGSDRYYTNGIFFFYREALPFDIEGKLANKVLGFEFGQKMYNPQSGNIQSNIPDDPRQDILNIDRPFAAYTYFGATYNLLYKNQSNIKVGAQIGLIGPKAQGEQIQNFIHSTFGFYPPFGWDHQIQGGIKFTLTGEYNKMLLRTPIFDANLSAYANIGNAFTGFGFGPLLRLGRTNKLFNSISTQSTITNRDGVKANDEEFFFYYKPMINIVAHDGTVQSKSGHLPQYYLTANPNDPSLSTAEITGTPETLVISNQIGAAYNSGDRWTFDLSAVFHTKDTKEMLRSHQWGSLAVMYHFN